MASTDRQQSYRADDPPDVGERRVQVVTVPAIVSISVDKLFGRYSYEIYSGVNDNPASKPNRLMLLYGENGSGKTTILTLAYHLLSPARRKGHRTYISGIEFRRFAISLSDGTTITARRTGRELKGTFSVEIEERGKPSVELLMKVSRSGAVDPKDELHDRLVGYLEGLRISPFYLDDNRTFSSDLLSEDEDELALMRVADRRRYLDYSRRSYRELLEAEDLDEISREYAGGHELLIAISRAERWLQQQAYRRTSASLDRASEVYADVLRHLLVADDPEEPSADFDWSSVGERLQKLAQRTQEYGQFDLGTTFPAQQFTRLLGQAPPDRREQLVRALAPHLESSEAQLDTLSEIFNLLTTFTSALNSLFVDKRVRFRARGDGLSILTTERRPRLLRPLDLSSGERQLLLLLCNTLVARENSRLFIIDEPEISLNVKWQRDLLDVLLDCTAGTGMQFLVATHSIEMLTTHQESVTRLQMTHET